MFADQIHPTLVESGGEVAIAMEEATGDNPLIGGELSDLMRQAITSDSKLRVVFSL